MCVRERERERERERRIDGEGGRERERDGLMDRWREKREIDKKSDTRQKWSEVVAC